MFISKMIYDPTWGSRNKAGRTVGLVFYTPKFWNCREYNFYSNQFDDMRAGELSEAQMERRYQSKRAHRNCKRKHLSSPGYMYWVGPKNRYVFNYMWWNLNERLRGTKPFQKQRDRADYIRWFDNGPKPPARVLVSAEKEARFQEILAEHNKQFVASLRKAEQTMLEYERIRERR